METASYHALTDEKQHSMNHLPLNSQYRHVSKRSQLVNRLIPVAFLAFAALLLYNAASRCHHRAKTLLSPMDIMASKKKVSLEAHIMSKCPDARDCLQQLVVPTMANMSDKVDFTLSYIGKIDPDSDDVHCMHGPTECLGNIIQLCAARIYPDPKLYLGFANCMTSDYSEIPARSLVQGCALEHGLDFERINDCISDEGHGEDLLRSSVERSQKNNVTKSCTVRLAGKIRCIRDGGEWYDCPGGSDVSDLVHDIQSLYDDQ